MPSQPTAQVAVQWEFDNAASDPTYNVFHFAKLGSSSAWDSEELNTLIDEVGNVWSDTVGQVLTDDLTAVAVTARQVVEGDAFSVTKAPSEGTWLNIDTGTAANPWECAVVNHSSTAPGRRGVGRTFLPGIRASFIDSSGTVDAGIRAGIAGAFNVFREDVQEGTIPVVLVVYSRTYDSVATVLGSSVRPLVGIQRDRRAGSR